jgi:hypothetical protein
MKTSVINKEQIDRVLYFANAWRYQRDNQIIAEVEDSHNTVAVLGIRDLECTLNSLANIEGAVTVTTNEAGQCVAVTRTDDEGKILGVLWEAKVLGDDARECLLDVTTHYADFRQALIEMRASNEATPSDELYWHKQIDVLDRMNAQAARALGQVPIKSVKRIPTEGEEWRHRNGGIYTVLLLTSEPGEDKADKFPRSVVYRAEDGRTWTRTLESWYKSFTPL